MKISATIPALDLAPPPAAANDGSAGRGFDVAVREIAAKAGEREKPAPAPRGEDGRPVRAKTESGSSSAGQTKAAAPEDEDAPGDAAPAEDGAASAGPTPTADLLGRLLLAAGFGAMAAGNGQSAAEKAAAEKSAAGKVGAEAGEGALSALSQAEALALAAAALAATSDEGTTFDGALEERLVITPLGAGAAEAKASGASGGRTGVGLEVLHMETHFEPRVDDVVLVEGAAPTAAAVVEAPKNQDGLDSVLSTIRLGAAASSAASATGQVQSAPERGKSSPDTAAPATRFDETLARLAAGEGATAHQDAGDDGERKGARDDKRPGVKSADESRQPAARSDAGKPIDTDVAMSAPVPGSMTGQIADRIIDAFRPASAGQRPADLPSEATHLRLTAGGAALKTLTIQLQPENLGKLEVSMRLVDGRLTLELAASSAETAVALGADRAGLKKLLEHAGFSMDEASITIVSRDSTAQMTRAGAAPDSGGSAQQGPSGDGQRGSNGTPSGERGFERGSGSRDQQPAPGQHRGGDRGGDIQPRRSASTFL